MYENLCILLSIRVRFILSVASVCYEFLFKVNYHVIVSCLQNSINLQSRYPPPLLLCKYLILRPVWFSTSSFHSLNFLKTLDFFPHEVDPNHSWLVIQESNKVTTAAIGSCWYRSPHIRVNVVNKLLCVILYIHEIEGYLLLLFEDAILTEVKLAWLQSIQ